MYKNKYILVDLEVIHKIHCFIIVIAIYSTPSITQIHYLWVFQYVNSVLVNASECIVDNFQQNALTINCHTIFNKIILIYTLWVRRAASISA